MSVRKKRNQIGSANDGPLSFAIGVLLGIIVAALSGAIQLSEAIFTGLVGLFGGAVGAYVTWRGNQALQASSWEEDRMRARAGVLPNASRAIGYLGDWIDEIADQALSIAQVSPPTPIDQNENDVEVLTNHRELFVEACAEQHDSFWEILETPDETSLSQMTSQLEQVSWAFEKDAYNSIKEAADTRHLMAKWRRLDQRLRAKSSTPRSFWATQNMSIRLAEHSLSCLHRVTSALEEIDKLDSGKDVDFSNTTRLRAALAEHRIALEEVKARLNTQRLPRDQRNPFVG